MGSRCERLVSGPRSASPAGWAKGKRDTAMNNEATITRLGVLGGTFDPPHYGHLLLADTARAQLSLERVLFAPVGQPPHKPMAQPSSIAHRVAMVQAALDDADEPVFRLCRVDVDRPGPHYTVDALAILRETYPEAKVWFLIGADSLADLAEWYMPDQIIALARLGVLPRPGYEPNLGALASRMVLADGRTVTMDLGQRVDWLVGPALDISSSALRERAKRQLPLRFLVPPSVEVYVRQHCLY
jgi:nicotinate-nucleotide adenylyltransferase